MQSMESGCLLTECQFCCMLPNEMVVADYAAIKRTILRSKEFRSLKDKTQILPIFKYGIHATNRLSHSMDVAKVLRSAWREHFCPVICEMLEVCGLLHDIGHPPFGHAGERALDKILCSQGGFESNAQMYRILKRFDLSFLAPILVKHKQQIPKAREFSYRFYKGIYIEDVCDSLNHNCLVLDNLSRLVDVVDELCYCITDIRDLYFALGFDQYSEYLADFCLQHQNPIVEQVVHVVLTKRRMSTFSIVAQLLNSGLIDIDPLAAKRPAVITALLELNHQVLKHTSFYQEEFSVATDVIGRQYQLVTKMTQEQALIDNDNDVDLSDGVSRRIGDFISAMTESEIMKTTTLEVK